MQQSCAVSTWRGRNFSMKDNSLSVSHSGKIPTVYSLHWSECKVQQSQRLLTIIITITWHSLKVSSHTLNEKASMRGIHWAQLNAFNQSAELDPWNACPSPASCINPVGPIHIHTHTCMKQTNVVRCKFTEDLHIIIISCFTFLTLFGIRSMCVCTCKKNVHAC